MDGWKMEVVWRVGRWKMEDRSGNMEVVWRVGVEGTEGGRKGGKEGQKGRRADNES